ncbi:MAG: nucleotidyltransferase domain-containing protein [Bacillales bacterium]|nr:nucleotidyltransferase domain-containing protein [Bacillales bacterium]
MQINNRINIKLFYRFIEFTSKLLGTGLTHEKIKLLALDIDKAESLEEINLKRFSSAHLYLLNSVSQSFTKDILDTSYFILSGEKLDDEVSEGILNKYYMNLDDAAHYLSSLIHFAVLDSVSFRKVEFAFLLSNYVMLKKETNPIIIYDCTKDKYNKAIEDNDIDELGLVFFEAEQVEKPKESDVFISKEQIFSLIKENRPKIKDYYNVKKLYLYGSYAKEKTTGYSDLDFLVVYKDKILNTEKTMATMLLREYLDSLFHVKTDIIDFTHALEKLDIGEMENTITLI